MTASGVFINDENLVALYRYDNGPYVADTFPIPNKTLASSYIGTNSLVASGRFLLPSIGGDHQSPPNAPLTSGQWFGSGLFRNGFEEGDHFHLAAESGNMSGMQATSGDSLSVGTWVKVSGWNEDDEITLLGRSFDTTQVYFFHLAKFPSSVTTQTYIFEFGTESGVDFEWVRSNPFRTSGVWEHVVGVVNSDTQVASIYVNGIDVTSGMGSEDKIYAPPGSGDSDDLVMPFKIGSQTYDPADLWVTGNLGQFASGWLGESFVMNRALNNEEVSGIYLSGLLHETAVSESDIGDSLKDNTGEVGGNDPKLIVTAWDSEDQADPSGFRHALSGIHPAFSGLMTSGSSALDTVRIPTVKAAEVSDTVALTLHSRADNRVVDNIRFWMSDFSGFSGLNDFHVTTHIDPLWLPGLHLPSGSGIVASSLATADSILRSDGATAISGDAGRNVNDVSGEGNVSQYIYLAFDSNTDFSKGNFGPSGFELRFTVDLTS